MCALRCMYTGVYMYVHEDINVHVADKLLQVRASTCTCVFIHVRSNLKAGTELTYDYRYIIGSLPDRIILCYCKSTNCQLRLL